jgi:Mce-associated membrane protein
VTTSQGLLVEEDLSAVPADAPQTLPQKPLRRGSRWAAFVVTLLVLAGAAAACWQYIAYFRPDVATNPQVADTVIAAARDGTVAILSYAPGTLERDFATAKSHLGGDFLAYYNEFTEQVVRPAATEKKIKTTAEVTRAAISELHPDSAKVLVFIDQNTMSADKPDPVPTASSVLVTLFKHGDVWLISGFDPV